MQETHPEPREEARWLTRRIIRLTTRIVVAGVVLWCGVSWPQKILLLQETNRAMAQETASLEWQLQNARQERQSLEEEKKFLRTRAGIITEARKLGYGFPGEIRLMPVPEEDQEPAQ